MAISISVPASPSPPRSPHAGSDDGSASSTPEATNTVAVTSLPKSFFDPLILNLLRDHFASYGAINQWVPLPGFGRVIVVYEADASAEEAKVHSDPIVLRATEEHPEVMLRVFRADRNPLIPTSASSVLPTMSYLLPPPTEKNFLISPPGSPPVGWEQIREDPPNSTPLADDLIAALLKLKVAEEVHEETEDGLEVLIHPDEAGVGVFVEDCDREPGQGLRGRREVGEVEEEWVYGETVGRRVPPGWRPVATAMPPRAMVV